MQRLIVTSATYRQSSKVTPALLEKDPENRLLARGPRLRLPAEMIRDTALAASGLLNDEIGGPSVFPYQPTGLWEEMAFGEGFSAQAYEQSHGKDLYRRGMYTFWKRTVPPASLATFDAPDREKCTARRALTNTPLQALALLNDPTYVEAARALAQRALLEGGQGRASADRIRVPAGDGAQADRQGDRACCATLLRRSSWRRSAADRQAAAQAAAASANRRATPARCRGARRVDHGGERDPESRRDDHEGVTGLRMRIRSVNSISHLTGASCSAADATRHRRRRARRRCSDAIALAAARSRARIGIRRPAASPACRISRRRRSA